AVLVAVPLVLGTVLMMSFWAAIVYLLVRPLGLDIPLLWPAFLLAASLAWLQALAWMPFGLPVIRLVLAVVVLSLLTGLSVWNELNGVSIQLHSAILASLTIVAYAAAAAGVARARHGEVPEWRTVVRLLSVLRGRRKRELRHFRSPVRAELWFEWRQS